jgi:hypothetical protein
MPAVRKRKTKAQKFLEHHDREEEIGKWGDWKLVYLPWRHDETWYNLKLYYDKRGPKNTWRFGWNGERFSKSRDFSLLEKKHPEILFLVMSVVRSL